MTSRPITVNDLQEFIDMIELNESDYDKFNVSVVKVVLGTFLNFVKTPREED